MKLSIATTISILALAFCLGWQVEERITTARERNARLVADAERTGIRLDSGHPPQITKRLREDRSVNVTVLADGLLALFALDEASRSQEYMEQLGEMYDSLEPAGFRELFAKLQESAPSDMKSREDSLQNALNRFSMMFPQETLEFLAESPDVFETGNPGKINAIHCAIDSWAGDAPDAALKWYRENKDKSPDFSGEGVPKFLLSALASTDLKMAFRLLAGSEFPGVEAESIMRWAATQNSQAALEGLREYAQGLSDLKAREQLVEQSLKSLSRALSQQDFTTSEKWLKSAKLNQTERETIARNLKGSSFPPADTGRWIEWIAEALPTVEADPMIVGFVRHWGLIDYQAVEKWLIASPDGPTKNTAICTYAETASKHQPETAAQWALTLPPGKDRDDTLKTIHKNWPKEDPAARDAFAKEHGIK